MNIIVLHGDDVVKSRLRLEKFMDTAKKRGWEIVRVNTEGIPISETFSSQSLFDKERFFIMEDASGIRKADWTWLKKNSKNFKSNLIIFHEGVISQTIFKSLPSPYKVEEFKLPRIIFEFLAAIYPGNAKSTLKLFHEVLTSEPPELVLALLGSHLRDLYLAKISPSILKYPGWRMGRLKSQSEKFTKENLENLIHNLAEVDVQTKTGEVKLSDSLDLLIITQLQ